MLQEVLYWEGHLARILLPFSLVNMRVRFGGAQPAKHFRIRGLRGLGFRVKNCGG